VVEFERTIPLEGFAVELVALAVDRQTVQKYQPNLLLFGPVFAPAVTPPEPALRLAVVVGCLYWFLFVGPPSLAQTLRLIQAQEH
jgi:hypothetical protein